MGPAKLPYPLDPTFLTGGRDKLSAHESSSWEDLPLWRRWICALWLAGQAAGDFGCC